MNLSNLLLATPLAWLDYAALFGRLFIGVCFVIHGLGKIGVVGSGSLEGFTQWLKNLGLPAPALQARAAMLSEIIGGSLIALGLMTRIGLALCLVTMIVAGLIGHRGGGYLITNQPPGNEYTINLSVILIILAVIGPGIYSLDYLIFRG
jgi:putative oxidoreductase